MDKKEAYKIVFEDLSKSNDTLLQGFFEVKTGSKKFMYGILYVLDRIVEKYSDEDKEEFDKKFLSAMIACEKMAKKEDINDG